MDSNTVLHILWWWRWTKITFYYRYLLCLCVAWTRSFKSWKLEKNSPEVPSWRQLRLWCHILSVLTHTPVQATCPAWSHFRRPYIWLFPQKVGRTGSFSEVWHSISESSLHTWEIQSSPALDRGFLAVSFIPQGRNDRKVLEFTLPRRKEREDGKSSKERWCWKYGDSPSRKALGMVLPPSVWGCSLSVLCQSL